MNLQAQIWNECQTQQSNGGYIKNEHHGMISPAMRRIIYLDSESGTP
jgi:hypothetical protein